MKIVSTGLNSLYFVSTMSFFSKDSLQLIIYKESNLTFFLCCKVLATLRFYQFITVPNVKFDMCKLSIRLVDPQVCTHLLGLVTQPVFAINCLNLHHKSIEQQMNYLFINLYVSAEQIFQLNISLKLVCSIFQEATKKLR